MRSSAAYFGSGDVLYGRLRPYLNKVYKPGFEGLASAEFMVFPSQPHLDNSYLQYFLNQWEFACFASRLNAGDRPRVDFIQLSVYPFPLAPLPEQHRIVAEIETQFTRLDASVAALKRAQANLKRYRASVLKAACEGKLVPTEAELARQEGRDYQPASVLLERILKERRARWEAQEKRRGQYKEPAPQDAPGLPGLPEGWVWATVEQVMARSEYGTSVKCTYEATGLPVLRIPNIVAGEIDVSDLKHATVALDVGAEEALQIGDILMCRTNGSVSLIGKTAVVRLQLDTPHVFASYLLRFRLAERDTLPLWLHIYQSSRHGRAFIESHAASSAGQHNVSLTLIHGMPFPVPPLAEQQRIVAEVERHLSVIQAAENIVAANLKRSERLRQSILKQAFSGKLVPQDPADEPASVLLERIRADRATSPNPLRLRRGLKIPLSAGGEAPGGEE
jgi:type I restriction enzyme S subunit